MTDFCSTSYLYVIGNSEFLENIKTGIEKYGLNFGGSRFNNMCPDIYDQAEVIFSKFLETEDTLIASSGTLAGILFNSILVDDKGSLVFQSFDAHPAFKNPLINYIEFYNFEQLKEIISSQDPAILKYIILNSINPSTLNCINSEYLLDFKRFENTIFIIDDSHGLGIIDEDGQGFSPLMRRLGLKYVIISSLAKAYGIRGGIISGDKSLINTMRNSRIWGGASPPPPFYFYAFLKSQQLYKDELSKLRNNISFFKNMMKEIDIFKHIDYFPVFLFKKKFDVRTLEDLGIIISSFRYPTKNDPLIQRIVLNSGHQFEEIESLVKVVNMIY
jgi:8-amino-7-oxononanoate synthase